MVPLRLKTQSDPRFPDFSISRIVTDVQFEAVGPEVLPGATVFDSAVVDTGAGYLVIPQQVHKSQLFKIHQEFGLKPYRVTSMKDDPILQRFAELGLRFLVTHPDGTCGYWPDQFIRVTAYLLDAEQRPKNTVLLGLDLLLQHFITNLEKGNTFLKARGSP
jgi:hypothetical protein